MNVNAEAEGVAMNGLMRIGVFALCVGATGCASSAHRETNGLMSSRAMSRINGRTAPKQIQVSLPPEQPDLFAAVAPKTDQRRLSQYFPGLGRPAGNKAEVVKAGQGAAMTKSVDPTESKVAASTHRPAWFGFRKPRGVQTYLTDARSASSRSLVEPSFLPVALQLPQNRVADSAVTPTNVELPASQPDVPNTDAASSSPTEPQLADKPVEARNAEATTPKENTAEPAPEVPTVDPRERPRLPATVADSTGTARDDQPEPKATESAQPSESELAERPPRTDSRAVKATPTAADPENSLGLPPATLPASYTSRQSIAVRGTTQSPQPPPVLASPQVEASPQSSVVPTRATKTWRRPCLRRLVRRMCNLGEFANPPTAKPH